MANKIEREAAEAELARIIETFEVDPEGADWEDARKRLLYAIQRGRITLDEDKATITLHLVAPIERESGGQLDRLTFREPNASGLKVLDKYRENEKMAKTIHLASKMSGEPVGVVERMGARDLSVMGAISQLFF